VSDVPPQPPGDPYGAPTPPPPPPPPGGYPPPAGGYPPPAGGYPPQPGGYPPPAGGYPPPAGYPGYTPPVGYSGTLAEWPQRALGLLIDFVPAIVIAIIGVVLPTVLGLLLDLVVAAYGIWLAVQFGQVGSTPGMRVVGLRGISEKTGQPIGGGMGFVRSIAHIVDSLICYIGWLFPLWDSKKQTIGDKLVGTVVVTVPKQKWSLTPTT
jgi:uncharacterized RDD family membrane protein YckC